MAPPPTLRPTPRRTAGFALVAAAVALAAAGCRGRVRRYEVTESSMRPSLQSGDYLVAVLANTLERGDIVIYPDPAEPSRDLIKRVIAVGGERVAIAGGRVAIDGRILIEPWADGPTHPDGSWLVPPNTVFTLGDNRRLSSGDSRRSGPIPASGSYRAVWRYWPAAAAGRIRLDRLRP